MSGPDALCLTLRRGTSLVTVALRGPEGLAVQPLADLTQARVVAVSGPPGPPGSGSVRFDVSAASASWVINHGFGRVPSAAVYLSTGEQVIANVFATSTTINVVFAAAQTGFVIVT